MTPETHQRVYTYSESEKARREATKAPKRFIDSVVRIRDPQPASLLYDAFVTLQQQLIKQPPVLRL
ncbi:hypothetical protein [Pyrobaculum calidifontis]|uniref:hypothetical protein n=1 Tax=Pyrobaculum calidifontis TaxID=181486 RepID=UPI000322B2C3|nr:hypothetical protein [Pyrobaculum calidifontis]